jgi:long-chain acyl-CoA synthetase
MQSQTAAANKPWPAMSIAQAHALLTAPGSPFEMDEIVIRGVKTRVWKNPPNTFRDVFVTGRTFGDRIFLVYQDERVSFEAFARASLAVAHALIADGVAKGDRVAVLMRNLPEWPAAFFGAVLAGAIATPLNAWWTGQELEYGLVDSGAKVLIVDAERFERLKEHLAACPDLQRIFVARSSEDSADPRVRRFEDVTGPVAGWAMLPDRPLPDVAIDPEDDATIFYTSGTTGKPKGALGTHRSGVCNVQIATLAAARGYLRRGEPVPTPDPTAPQRAALLSVPFFHVTGCLAILNPTLATGGKLVTMRRWDAEAGMRLIERERVTMAGGVPTIAWQLLEHPAREKYDLSSLDSVAYGGAPGSPELVRRIKETWPKSQPGMGWGMTETGGTVTGHSAEDYEHRPDSAGPPAPVCDLIIRDPIGRELPPGEVGELWAKGPNIVRGYWKKPEATAETFVDGFVRTGDLAKLDAEGFLYIVDRTKDMLIRGGENIYCVEVEDALYAHPAIMDAAVVGLPHKILGEEPAAAVTLKPGGSASEDDIKAFVAARLAAFKVPVKVTFWPEPLPRNANGKILKHEIKKLLGSAI